VTKLQENTTTAEVVHGGRVVTLLKGLAWVLVALGLVVVLGKFIRVPPGRDSSAFLYVGKGILQGDIPYLDRWDHKGPLLYLINAVALLISGAKEVWGLWVMEMAVLLGTVYFACKILARAFNMTSLVTMLIIVYFFLHWSMKFDLGGNFTEFYAIFFQFLSILCVFNQNKVNNRFTDRSSLIIGALGGSAFLLRPNLVGLWLAIGIYWLARKSIRSTVMASVGGLATLSIFFIVIVLVGGSNELWDAMFTYNFSYVNTSLLDKIKALNIVAAKRLGIFMSLLITLSWLMGLVACLRTRRQKFSGILEITVIALPLELALICSAGSQYQYTHYILPILPSVVVLIAHLLYVINSNFSYSNLSYSFIALIFYLFLIVNVFLITAPAQSQWVATAEYIKDNTTENDRILVWGAQSEIYLYSNRSAPTRFFYQYPLITNHYTSNILITEFIDDVIRNKPIFIVDTHNSRLPPLDKYERQQWNPPQGRYIDRSNNFESFFQFVDTHYRLVTEDEQRKLVYRYAPDLSLQSS